MIRVIEIGTKRVYRFNCPNCGSRLEAEPGDLLDIGGKICEFFCSICKANRHISWSELIKKHIYESVETR